MMLSDEKVTHLSHVLLKGLLEKNLVKLKDSEAAARKVIKRVVTAELKAGQAIDTSVRRKLESYSRKIVENSPEWEVLYRKFYQEEEAKRGRSEG
ncbi:MAG: DUF507 family protein [Nitrospiraceae bacterium]|nr:DUF507 family protein [Nitrospiraceae bacterium]